MTSVTLSLILWFRFCLSALQIICCHDNVKYCILLEFCKEEVFIFTKNTSKFCVKIDWARFGISTISRMRFLGRMNNLILLKFGTKVKLRISKKL